MDELEAVLLSMSGVFDGEEPVDELTHALQSGNNALRADAHPECIVAALFHDVAHSPLVGPIYPDAAHDVAGAAWLASRFGERVAWLAGAHVAAKLHLVATVPGYLDCLTNESKASAARQRNTPPIDFDHHPWGADALNIRRWDDAAKDPTALAPSVNDMLCIVRPLLMC